MPLIIGGNRQASTGPAYPIEQSIRFNDDDSAYMQRVLSSGNRRLITLSLWLKLGNASTYGIFGTDTSNASGRLNNRIYISDGHFTHIQVDSSGNNLCNFKSLRKLRDVSAWYHLVLVIDTANALESERLRLYINGERETNFDNNEGGSFSCSQNLDTNFNNGEQHLIGALAYNNMGNISNYFDGYMAEIHYLDGYGYGPEFFGEFNDSGIWIPKEYSGSYGTNGFKIDGRDSSDLGDDESGNGNDFTTSGLASHDFMLDSPTNNFCVMNAIENVPCNFSEGNLTIDSTSNFSGAAIRGTVHIQGGSTGKWYYEVVGSLTGDYFSTGWMLSSIITPGSTVIGQDTGSVAFYNTGSYQNGSNAQGAITKPAAGDVIGVGLDASTGQVFLRDDSGYFVGTLSSNALSSGVAITGFSGEDLVMASRNSSSGTATYNFGQDGTFAGAKTAQGNTDANGIGNFFYTVPDGFLAICTKNLGS